MKYSNFRETEVGNLFFSELLVINTWNVNVANPRLFVDKQQCTRLDLLILLTGQMHFFMLTVAVFFIAEAGVNFLHSPHAFPHYNSLQTELIAQHTQTNMQCLFVNIRVYSVAFLSMWTCKKHQNKTKICFLESLSLHCELFTGRGC
jgi:hypothetical protein